jgi:hypothetical protein
MNKGLIARIEREAGVPDLLQVLTTRLAPTDLQSLLLEIHARLAGSVTPKRLLEQYESNRFVAPSSADPRLLGDIDRLAWRLLPDGYVPLELAPLCPLGTNSAVASVSQHKVVSTVRHTEVVADSANVLTLECAIRRRRLRQVAARRLEPVLLAASHRVTRAQAFKGAGLLSHFRLLTLCAGGRDQGSFRFEGRHLTEQIGFYVCLIQEVAKISGRFGAIRVAVTDFTDGQLTATLEEQVLQPLSEQHPEVECGLDPTRPTGRGYYDRVCFKVVATDATAGELTLADGGLTDWTRRLLSDEKERLVVSGIGVERLAAR